MIEAKTAELAEAAGAELDDVLALGGAFEAIDELKRRLVRSQAERVRRIETGEQKVVGVNCFTETAPSPLLGDGEFENILKVDHRGRGRADRRGASAGGPSATPRRSRAALDELRRVADDDGPRATSWRRPSPSPTPAARPGSGPARCARCSASSAPRPASAAASAAAATTWRRVRLRTQAPGRAHRRPAPPAGGQAGPRRPLQRRRADRRGGARRRLRGDLPGHPAHPGADRGGRPRRGRRHRRAVHPVGLATSSSCPTCSTACVPPAARRAVVVGGIIPPDDAELLLGKGVASRLHAEGLFLRPHHGGPGGAGRAPARRHSRVSRAISRQVTATAPSSMARSRRASGTS